MIDFNINRNFRPTEHEIGHRKLVLSSARMYDLSGLVDEERPILGYLFQELGMFPARKLDVDRILEGMPNKKIQTL
jgi:hypothetical protein